MEQTAVWYAAWRYNSLFMIICPTAHSISHIRTTDSEDIIQKPLYEPENKGRARYFGNWRISAWYLGRSVWWRSRGEQPQQCWRKS